MPILQTITENVRVPVRIWTPNIEVQALQQLKNVASLPFVYNAVAAMPDAHFGMGACVGSVIPTLGAVMPAAVGVDIGCGMMAIKINLKKEQIQDKLKEIRHSIERSVPVGHRGNNLTVESALNRYEELGQLSESCQKFSDAKAIEQMGSLGGGNHFIEICLDQDDAVWCMLHSGSRNVGKRVADFHLKVAQNFIKRYFIALPSQDENLAYLVENTPEFDAYIKDVGWCQAYATANRQEMMDRVIKDLSFAVFRKDNEVEPDGFVINCHHNYVEREFHYGKNVWVTRKGAIRARKGDLGIIPGSMGSRSYITIGLENLSSFKSSSHGAGRKMSRNEARKLFTLETAKRQLASVECRVDDGILDELPGAYKDIDEVMNNQSDLTRTLFTLRQVVCIKG